MNRNTAMCAVESGPAFGPTPSGEYEAALESVITKCEQLHIALFAHAELHAKHPHGWKFVDDMRKVDVALGEILKGLK